MISKAGIIVGDIGSVLVFMMAWATNFSFGVTSGSDGGGLRQLTLPTENSSKVLKVAKCTKAKDRHVSATGRCPPIARAFVRPCGRRSLPTVIHFLLNSFGRSVGSLPFHNFQSNRQHNGGTWAPVVPEGCHYHGSEPRMPPHHQRHQQGHQGRSAKDQDWTGQSLHSAHKCFPDGERERRS